MSEEFTDVSLEDRFAIWYLSPLRNLEKMDFGHGAIAALTIAMPLYERVYMFLVTKGLPDNRPEWVKEDLKLNSVEEAKLFWNVFRDGLCHTGSFFEQSGKYSELPKIGLDAKYPDFPTFKKNEDNEDVIIVNPWKLITHILGKYKGNTEILSYAPAPLLPLQYKVINTTT